MRDVKNNTSASSCQWLANIIQVTCDRDTPDSFGGIPRLSLAPAAELKLLACGAFIVAEESLPKMAQLVSESWESSMILGSERPFNAAMCTRLDPRSIVKARKFENSI